MSDKDSGDSVYRKRHQDRLNRALRQADVAGLRAVRPAGFVTQIPPKRGVANCSVAVVPLEWRIDTGERGMLVPFGIEPVLGKRFGPLLPAAMPVARPSNAVIAASMRCNGAVWLPLDELLKLAFESAPRKLRPRKGLLRRLPRNGVPLGFIRQELTGGDIYWRPHVTYVLAHAQAALQPALVMSLREMSTEFAPALTVGAQAFIAVAPGGAAPQPAGVMREDSPPRPVPAPMRLPIPIETPASAPQFSIEIETRSGCPRVPLRIAASQPALALASETEGLQLPNIAITPVAPAIPSSVGLLRFSAVPAKPMPPTQLGLQIAIESAPELPAQAESFPAVAPEAPDFGKHPLAAADLLPLEYLCQRSRITPALHAEWTRRALSRVLPGMPFDTVVGAVEDLLPEKDAKPFFVHAPKVENRRWGSRYLELAAAAIVLATVLATGLHIARSVRTSAPNVPPDVAALRVNAAPAPVKPLPAAVADPQRHCQPRGGRN